MASVLKMCRQISKVYTKIGRKNLTCLKYIAGTAAVGLATVSAEQRPGLQVPDPSSLTHCALICNACGLTIDSATALISQTASALLQSQQDYMEAMQAVIELLENRMSLDGNMYAQDRLWEEIVATRNAVNQHRRDIGDLEVLCSSAEKTLLAAAEVAFLAGAETYSVLASERIHSIQQHLVQSNSKVAAVVEQLHITEAKHIMHHKKKQDTEREKPPQMQVQVEELIEEDGDNKQESSDDESVCSRVCEHDRLLADCECGEDKCLNCCVTNDYFNYMHRTGIQLPGNLSELTVGEALNQLN